MYNFKVMDVVVEYSFVCGYSFDFMCVEWWCVLKVFLGWFEMDIYLRMEWVVYCGRILFFFCYLCFIERMRFIDWF